MNNELREQAKKLFLDSKGDITTSQISERLDVPITTVRYWRGKDNWSKLLKVKKRNKPSNRDKRYNDRAVGHIVTVHYENLTDTEKALITAQKLTPRQWLERDLSLCMIRENRILREIEALLKDDTVILPGKVTSIQRRNADGQMETVQTTTEGVPRHERLLEFETALARTQSDARSTAIALHKMDCDDFSMSRVTAQNTETNDVEDLTPLALLLNGEMQEQSKTAEIVVDE